MTIAGSFRRTRLAPTPSGFLHIGNVLSFAITVALARQTGAAVLLRIDDLDRERLNPVYVQDIFDTLRFLDIPWDEGPRNITEYENSWSQLHRMDIYRTMLQQLRSEEKIFACTCSRAQVLRSNAAGIYTGTCRNSRIDPDTPDASWRLRTEEPLKLEVKNIPGSFTEAALPASMQDFIIRKKDGFPAYQLASLADDLHFGVDLVVRGIDLWPSTLAQHYLAVQLGQQAFLQSSFYHHPLLMDRGEVKLSKSAGATSVQYLRRQGWKPADIYTEIARMLGGEISVADWQQLANLLSEHGLLPGL